MSTDDRPNVERLAEEWANADEWNRRVFGRRLKAAIKTDRASGWLSPRRAQSLIEERDVWSAEVDRQAAEIERLTERVGWEEHLLERAERAEAEIKRLRTEVRALVEGSPYRDLRDDYAALRDGLNDVLEGQ